MKIFFINCIFNPRNDRRIQQLSTDTGAQFPIAGVVTCKAFLHVGKTCKENRKFFTRCPKRAGRP